MTTSTTEGQQGLPTHILLRAAQANRRAISRRDPWVQVPDGWTTFTYGLRQPGRPFPIGAAYLLWDAGKPFRARCADCGGERLALLTVTLDDPTGYGRIVRDEASRVRAIVEEVETWLREQLGIKPRSVEGLSDASWVLLDFGDLVVHVFLTETREYYDLERLWRTADRVPLGDDDAAPAHRHQRVRGAQVDADVVREHAEEGRERVDRQVESPFRGSQQACG